MPGGLTLTSLDNAARDLQTVDDFANSASPTTTTRGGASVPTRAGLTAEFPQATAQAAIATAQAATAQAQALIATGAAATAVGARDASLIQAGVYVDEPTGRAAVANGVAFKVQGSGVVAAFEYRRVDASSSTLIGTYPSTAAIIDNRLLASGDNYSTPPAALTETVATASPVSVGTAALKGVALSAGHPATIPGIARTFSAKFATALAGRKVEFYVFTPSGGSWICTYASGLQDASASGINTFTVPTPTSVRVGVGDIVGAYTDAAANADGFFLATSGGPTIGPTVANTGGARVSVGATITSGSGSYTSDNSRYYGISVTTAHEAILVPARWANLPNGWLKLDAAGKLDSTQLPGSLAENASRSASAGVVTTEYDPALLASKVVSRPDTATSTLVYTSVSGTIHTTGNTYPTGRIVIGWVNGSPGFLKAGTLTTLRLPPCGDVSAGAKFQAWVVRPTTAPGANGSSLSVTKVATIGEIAVTDRTKYHEFAGLSIPVLAGDLIALRPINAGLRWGDAATEYTNLFFLDSGVLADQTLAALDGGLTATVASSRKFDMYAEVAPGPYRASDSGPGAVVRRDSSGNLPASVYRSADAPWAGLKIAAVGTSITAGAAATGNNGYIPRLAQMLQCQVQNNGVGSSGIVWDGLRALSLGATQAQLTAAGFSPLQSYEVKVLGQAADLFIFDHGYNDRDMPIGTIADATAATFYGAYNKVLGALIAERPSQRFMLITPHSVFSPFAEGQHATTENIRQAMLALAQKYCCPILDWTYTTQLSASQASTFLPGDGVHPNDAWHAMATRVLYQFIKGI